ncbi:MULTISPECIES: virulence RhuM family protein [unclassified Sulfurospirillum]|uniref:virulence RhuM family protein n=1 Tax=unclassified Sulfurospirillum TaxID=2618290 RepID=UPI0005420216|nr:MULTISPECIES: RhuM family protein [unclassified Sulfurospirillum]KHG34144.1 MAG: DNA-binding protein [Sulfurospirillum sp. MES]MCD8544357.1 virulence RhuM family protein [Sulfurospirillum cavolei]MCP3652882.1 virulence RhuM family protein [Sulfurospirillum sp. DNRA8]MCR1811734.1 virulence RhuM family protein [Sulfurospirillum sp. DNRA8]
MNHQSHMVVYSDGEIELNVSVDEETVWLNRNQISDLFGKDVKTIGKHINNIFNENELAKPSTVAKFAIVQKEGERDVKRDVEFYNLDMIISLGYRVNSKKATKFRQWATSVLKQYIQNGYALNSHKMTEQRLSALEKDIATIKSHIQNRSLEIKQGIFFNGQIFDAYVFLSDLIKSAKTAITLIDNYIDESILTLFSKNKTIKFTIYTANISKQLQLDIEKYNKQYNNLTVQTTKNFHDRFLICDETVYHFGASLKDLGKKIFAVNQINIEVNQLLKNI